jgi:hypothetical protein
MNKKELQERIARVAYDLYEKRGKQHGCHEDDWILAEQIVMEELSKKAEAAPKAKTVRKKTAGAATKKAVAEKTAARVRKTTGRTSSATKTPKG